MENVIIREERAEDYGVIYDFVKTAFSTAKVKDGAEQNFVNKLRSGGKYIPSLALVSEENGAITGHIMLTKTYVSAPDVKFEGLLLAPVSTVLEKRNRGLGSHLIKESLARAKSMGYTAVFVVGDKNYYARFGFTPASGYNIKPDFDVPEHLADNIMALELAPGALKGVHGVVDLHG